MRILLKREKLPARIKQLEDQPLYYGTFHFHSYVFWLYNNISADLKSRNILVKKEHL